MESINNNKVPESETNVEFDAQPLSENEDTIKTEKKPKSRESLREKFVSAKERYANFQFRGIVSIVLIFVLMGTILFVERTGIKFNYAKHTIDLIDTNNVITKAEANSILPENTLVLWDSADPESVESFNEFKTIFADMKVSYNAIDVSKPEPYSFYDYEKTVILMSNLDPIGQNIVNFCEYVEKGGQALFAITLSQTPISTVVEPKLGILDSSYTYTMADSIYVDESFMIGGGRGFEITDGYESARAVQLSESNTNVYAYTNDERKSPLIWEAHYGDGKYVVINMGHPEKNTRGFFSAAYSLMGDVCAYPVINASTFYLDDFPSQIPSGYNEYIFQDYQTSTRDFYVNIWWPDMMNFADKYGIRYTGLAIKSYDDDIDGSTNAVTDRETFLSFGNMLLRMGGELGYHGYNHQPLWYTNVDYKGLYSYKGWQSYDAMNKAFDNLVEFCDELFPDVEFSVYVPPSNILSAEGRKFLINEYPQIRTISGIYFDDNASIESHVQEYGISEDGIIDQPRAVSGCKLEPFMEIAVISELNLHFSNNHFTHPDDPLDPERGAELGWEEMKNHFNQYLTWIYSSSPGLRNLTGSETSAAIQRWAAAAPIYDVEDDKMTITIKNFYDQVQFLVRFNEKTPGETYGGSLTHITGDLYLLKATQDTVTIETGVKS